jgi:nucleoside-triphosphatase THEP1
MGIQIKKAVKYGAKMRLALYGPSGSGKTYTALKIATEIAKKRIVVIDSERGSASKYADIFDFDVIELESFHPNSYVEAIKAVAKSPDHDVLIIDSISQEWDGSKGALELAGHNFVNWGTVTPLHNLFIDAMLSINKHLIVTMRAKEEHKMEEVVDTKTNRTKTQVKSFGIEPIQRKGIQYEFDVVCSLDIDNVLTVVKTRCSELQGAIFPRAGKEIAEVMTRWLDGMPAPEKPVTVKDAYESCYASGLVKGRSEFYQYASEVLGIPVTADNVMSLEQDYLKMVVASAQVQKSA